MPNGEQHFHRDVVFEFDSLSPDIFSKPKKDKVLVMEPKPIAIVYYLADDYGPKHWVIQEALEKKWPDYHVLVVPNTNQERAIELEIFYDNSFTDVQYEELKQWITEYIAPPTTQTP